MRRLAQDVEHVADAVTHRVNQVVALAAGALTMADVVERVDHEVDRHDVDPAAFQPDHRHPGRQQLAQPLDQLEKIVGSVDLVHLAGDAVAHHHGGAKHRPRDLAFLANDFFALMLGSEVGMIVIFSLFKHVLAEHALVQACRGNRADMMKLPGINGLGKLDRAAGAVNVDCNLAFLIGVQVINRRKVVEMGDLALELFDVFCADPELFAGQVAMHGNGPGRADAPVRSQGSHFADTFLADQEMNRGAFSLEQLLDQALADEAGGSRDEIMH